MKHQLFRLLVCLFVMSAATSGFISVLPNNAAAVHAAPLQQ